MWKYRGTPPGAVDDPSGLIFPWKPVLTCQTGAFAPWGHPHKGLYEEGNSGGHGNFRKSVHSVQSHRRNPGAELTLRFLLSSSLTELNCRGAPRACQHTAPDRGIVREPAGPAHCSRPAGTQCNPFPVNAFHDRWVSTEDGPVPFCSDRCCRSLAFGDVPHDADDPGGIGPPPGSG